MPGPCGWPATVVCPSFPDSPTPEQQAQLASAVGIAVETLWRASGRRYGICGVTVRPTAWAAAGGGVEPFRTVSGWLPVLDAGQWRNLACAPARADTLPLPGYVQAVQEVRIDGVLLSPSAYRVDGHSLLVRQDGQPWPRQDLSRALGQPGTWSVTYTHGLPISPLAVQALTAYVCELFKATDGQKCRLPARVEGIFRQGVNIDFSDDNLDLLSKGRTGIPETDGWLALVNPGGTSGPPSVHSPDLATARVTSWASP